MPLIVNRRSTREQYIDTIEKYFRQTSQLLKGHNDVLNDLRALRKFGLEMVEWVSEYDIVPEVQANGFRSILLLGIGLVAFAAKQGSSLDIDDFKLVLKNYRNAIPYIQRLRNESKSSRSLELSPETMTDFLVDYLKSTEQLKCYFNGRSGNHDLGFWGSLGMKAMLFYRSIQVAPSFIALLRCLIDSEYRRTIIAISATSTTKGEGLMYTTTRSFLHWFGKISPNMILDAPELGMYYVMRYVLPIYVNGFMRPDVMVDVAIPRQRRYLIKVDESNHCSYIEDTKIVGYSKEDQVIAHYFRNSDVEPEVLLWYCHGGAFLMGDRFSHNQSIRKWVNDVPGMAAISIEYSLSPETKFPTPLQQCLDSYLFLANRKNHRKVKSMLGFVPKKFILSGDSAGGTLSFALALALSDIRKKYDLNDIEFPSAIFVYFPFVSLYPSMKPSYMVNGTSGLLIPPGFEATRRAYVPNTSSKLNDEVDDNLNVIKSEESSSSITGQLLGWIIDRVKWAIRTDLQPQVLPFDESIIRNAPKEYALTKDPLVSPLYGDYSDFSEMSLYIFPCRVDGLLDEGLMCAAKWPGPRHVYVLNNVQHGFLYAGMMPNSYEAIEFIGSKLNEFVKKVKQQSLSSFKFDHPGNHLNNNVDFK